MGVDNFDTDEQSGDAYRKPTMPLAIPPAGAQADPPRRPIFGALDALNPGERMRFVNDHDPLPLLQQMRERCGESVEIQSGTG